MRAGELQGFPFFSFGNFLYLHSYEPFFRSLHLTFHLFSFPLLLLLLLPLFFFFFLFFCNFHSTSFKVPCEAPPLPPPLQISLGEINSKKLDDIIVLKFLYRFTVNFYILIFPFPLLAVSFAHAMLFGLRPIPKTYAFMSQPETHHRPTLHNRTEKKSTTIKLFANVDQKILGGRGTNY